MVGMEDMDTGIDVAVLTLGAEEVGMTSDGPVLPPKKSLRLMLCARGWALLLDVELLIGLLMTVLMLFWSNNPALISVNGPNMEGSLLVVVVLVLILLTLV